MFPKKVLATLSQMKDEGRQLLAVRSYLRVGENLKTRWSWTDSEIETFQKSRAYEALTQEIEAITLHFERNNPGYSLYVHAKTRSLDRQIRMWNTNKSVELVSQQLLAAWNEEGLQASLSTNPPNTSLIVNWLKTYNPKPRATLAAPGLTRHGKASAIDFQIMKDGEIVAGANRNQIETVWRGEAWDQKLAESVKAVGPSFKGPLKNPDEPWHFDYFPLPYEE